MDSTKEIKTDNELIAEFMGMELIIPVNKSYPSYYREFGLGGNVKRDYHPAISGEFLIFKYDTSWDWLMPAFGKFAALDLDDVDYSNHCVAISEKILECDIQGVYERLVEAIKWYNSQSK